ncbi:hypothetical protein ACFL2V_11780 [Pseudomonadota bacterium]
MFPVAVYLRKVGRIGICAAFKRINTSFCYRGRQCVAVLGMFVCLSVAAAAQDDFQIYGPETFFVDNDGRSVTKLFQFAEASDELYKLRVYNGGKSGEYGRVARFLISVNGDASVIPEEIDRGTGYVHALIPVLNGNNSLKITVYGSVGEGVTIDVVANDDEPPEVSTHIVPAPNELGWNNSDTKVSFTCEDNYEVVQCPDSLEVILDGEGYAIDGTAKDIAGNVTKVLAKVSLDKTPPTIKAVTSPAPNSLGWHTSDTTVSFICSDATAGVNTCPSSFYLDVEGEGQLFSGATTDKAGNSSSTQLSVNLDKTAPALRIVTPDRKYYQASEALEINLSYSDLNGVNKDALDIKLDDQAITLNCVKGAQSASCVSVDPISSGNHQLEVKVSDLSGLTTTATATFTYQDIADHDEDGVANDMDRCANTPKGVAVNKGGCYSPSLPPGPSSIATDLIDGESFLDQVEFLYAASNPVQRNVKYGVVRKARAAVVRGLVTSKSGTPMSGVKVAVKDHPELGHTYSRKDGVFDMVVNGGASFTFEYVMPGYLQQQAEQQVARSRYTWLPDAVMTLQSKQPISVDMSDNKTGQWVSGPVVSDVDGERHVSLFFPADVSALLERTDGTHYALNRINLGVTEYELGESETMKVSGSIPESWAHNYAVDLVADEEKAGRIVLSTPIALYVDNFLKFPVGHTAPAGWYDKNLASWQTSSEGRVIEVLVIRSGVAILDIHGEGLDASPSELESLGITQDELQALAKRYKPGDTLWRTTIDTLAPWAINWPKDAGLRASSPNAGNPKVGKSGNGYTIKVPLSDYAVPPGLQSIELTVVVAGQKFKRSFHPSTRQNYSYTWDGADAYGRLVTERVDAHVNVAYKYASVYLANQTQFPTQFSGQRRMEIATRPSTEIALSRDWKVPLYPTRTQSDNEAAQPQSREVHLGRHGGISNEGFGTKVITTSKRSTAPNAEESRALEPITATAQDGTLYVATLGKNNFIRSINPAGPVITLVPPNPQRLTINQLLVGTDNRLYYAALYLNEGSVIKRINADGSETSIAGGGGLYSDGILATRYRFDGLVSFEMERNESMTVFEEDVRNGGRKAYRVDRIGLIQSLAGAAN